MLQLEIKKKPNDLKKIMAIIIIESLVFCHYPTFWGYLLGLFQYLPTGLVLGSFFWSLACREPFFLSLVLTLKIVWVLAIIMKYLLIPNLVPSSLLMLRNETLIPCDSYIPTFLGYVSSLFFFPVTTTNSSFVTGNISSSTPIIGSDFPHIDVLQTGTYLGFVLGYCIYWSYPIYYAPAFGLLALAFVPWSFLSAGISSIPSIAASIYVGIFFGALGLIISYYVVYSCVMNKRNAKKIELGCYKFWCGKIDVDEGKGGLFFYNYKKELNNAIK